MDAVIIKANKMTLMVELSPGMMGQPSKAVLRRVKTVGRAAVAAATRPMAAGLKSLVRSLATAGAVTTMAKSGRLQVQSTGATGRSIQTKTGTSMSGNIYGIVAPDLKHIESHMLNRDLYRAWAKRRGVNVGVTRTGGRSRTKFMYVKSFATRRFARPQKRRPGKYWHLINNGFTHRFAGAVMGYQFVQRAFFMTQKASLDAFNRIWNSGIERSFTG